MAMHSECIAQVERTIGRRLRDSEAEDISRRIAGQMVAMRRKDPDGYAGKTQAEQLQEAARLAGEAMVMDARKDAQRKALDLLAQMRESRRIEQRAAAKDGKQPFHQALFERMRQVDTRIKGERGRAFSQIMETLRALEPGAISLLVNRQAERDFVRAVHGEAVDNPAMERAAKVWNDESARLLKQRNALGANVGQLDYAYIPQPADIQRLLRLGEQGYVDFMLPRLDRQRYVTSDGLPMNDAQVRTFLTHAYETLTTNGLNKLSPDTPARGLSSRATRYNDAHRQIHFKSADSYLEYMDRLGQGSVFEAMQGHVHAITKDIALMAELGPNPAKTFNMLLNKTRHEDRHDLHGWFAGTEFTVTPEQVWSVLNGDANSPVNVRFAGINQGIRNFMVAAKLQKTLLSSVTDVPSMLRAAKYNGIDMTDVMAELKDNFGSEYRAGAADMGLVVDSMISDMSSWHGEHLGQNWTGRLADTTMKVTLLQGWTNAIRRAFSVSLMRRLGDLSRKSWDQLGSHDRKRYENAGITQADWGIWRSAELEDWRGRKMLTADAVSRVEGVSEASKNQAIAKLLGFIQEESEYTAIGPDLMSRAAMVRGTRRGELGGELLRHSMMFKGFALGILSRHLRRIKEIESTSGKLGYSATLLMQLTLFGALSNQLHSLALGKDPEDMTTGAFWASSFVRGGGLGILGDIVYTGLGGDSRGGAPNWANLFGPVWGTAADITDTLLGDPLSSLLQGDDADAVANQTASGLLRIARQNAPFLNTLYLQNLVDHSFYHELQESVSPGYLGRMRARAYREQRQEYWWEPGTGLPARAPEFGVALGD